ncbi:unnamed protein product [Musa acuminata var. zebrina]
MGMHLLTSSGTDLDFKLLLLLLPLRLVDEGRDGERPPDPHRRLEVYLRGIGVGDAHLSNGHPQQQLLAPHPRHLLHLLHLHVRRHHPVVPHPSVGSGEEVLVRLLLLHPHEARRLHPPALFEVPQREDSFREADRLQHLYGVAVAFFRAVDDLRAFPVLVADDEGAHG